MNLFAATGLLALAGLPVVVHSADLPVVANNAVVDYCFPAVVMSAGIDAVLQVKGAPGKEVAAPSDLSLTAAGGMKVSSDAKAWEISTSDSGSRLLVMTGALAGSLDCHVVVYGRAGSATFENVKKQFDHGDPFQKRFEKTTVGSPSVTIANYGYIDPLGALNVGALSKRNDDGSEMSRPSAIISLVKARQ